MNRSASLRLALRIVFALATAAAAAPDALARPLITEEVAPIGKFMFEAAMGATYRNDEFNDGDLDYETVTIPARAKLGLTPRVEAGFELLFLTHRLETAEARYSGSRTSLFSPMVKYSPWDFFGLQFMWHARVGEESGQELPIARGDDFEIKTLFAIPARIPIEINFGYLFREAYRTRLGVKNGPEYKIAPGDVFETSIAAELPIRWGLALLSEAAYYRVGEQSVSDAATPASDGEAADALIGLTWERGGWSLGTGVSFGLLDESHTSFNHERGAGDYRIHWMAAYRLKPRKPGQ